MGNFQCSDVPVSHVSNRFVDFQFSVLGYCMRAKSSVQSGFRSDNLEIKNIQMRRVDWSHPLCAARTIPVQRLDTNLQVKCK